MERTPANRRLWHLACQLGTDLGLELEEGMAGGGSDGNTSSLYTATLDGLGAVGDGAHAHHEHLVLGNTLERAALLALLLLADAHRLSGRNQQALTLYLQIGKQATEPRLVESSQYKAARLLLAQMKRPAEAFDRFRESNEIARRIGDDVGATDSLNELGKLLMDGGARIGVSRGTAVRILQHHRVITGESIAPYLDEGFERHLAKFIRGRPFWVE